MTESARIVVVIEPSADPSGPIHLAREGAAKTMCRALEAGFRITGGPEEADTGTPVCVACLDVLKVDWLLEDAITRK